MTALVVADILSGRYVILGGVYCVSLVEPISKRITIVTPTLNIVIQKHYIH